MKIMILLTVLTSIISTSANTLKVKSLDQLLKSVSAKLKVIRFEYMSEREQDALSVKLRELNKVMIALGVSDGEVSTVNYYCNGKRLYKVTDIGAVTIDTLYSRTACEIATGQLERTGTNLYCNGRRLRRATDTGAVTIDTLFSSAACEKALK
jgi:hypothetical protein